MTWFGRRDPRLRDELRYHRDRLIEDYLAAGMDRQAAERKAFLEFGNVARFEEEVNDARGRLLADLLQDLRYASRTLRRAPGFSVVAIQGSLIYEWGHADLDVDQPGAAPQHSRGRYLTVWRQSAGGRWEIARNLSLPDD